MRGVGDENWLTESVKCFAVGSGGYLSSSIRDCHCLAGLYSLLDKRAVLKWLELYKRKPIFCYFIPNRSHENQHSDYNCLLTSAQMNRKLQNA
ncbi:hypothetical protein T06_1775 [Trichinella sp. T6]|nr:hypothetical protein T06_1775 [Trichinella sp. T6]